MKLKEPVSRDRMTRLGASDMAVLLGLSPYANAYTLHLEKTGQLENWSGNASTEDGQLYEPVILDRAEQRLGQLERDVFLPCPAGCPVGATLDARVIATGDCVEAKTTGLGERPIVGIWGDEGSSDIPEQYLVQVQVQMHCAAANVAHVAAWVGYRGIRYYRVDRDQDVIDQMLHLAQVWWQRHVIEGRPPEKSDPPPVEVFKRLKRQASKSVSLRSTVDKLVKRWEVAKAKEAKARDAQEKIKAKLLLSLGDAEEGVTPSGVVLSYYESERRGYTVQPTKVRIFKVKSKETKE